MVPPAAVLVALPVTGLWPNSLQWAGVALATKLTDPTIRVIGVQPERANATALSFAKGEVTAIARAERILDSR